MKSKIFIVVSIIFVVAVGVLSYGFFVFKDVLFVGNGANDITMENCHVVAGRIETGNYSGYGGGLVEVLHSGTIKGCSVTSSGRSLVGRIVSITDEISITACYVTGGNLVNQGTAKTYNASYYQQDGGDITAADGSTVSSWSEAMTAMNQALSGTAYQWVENEGTDKDTRPLVIKTQTTE